MDELTTEHRIKGQEYNAVLWLDDNKRFLRETHESILRYGLTASMISSDDLVPAIEHYNQREMSVALLIHVKQEIDVNIITKFLEHYRVKAVISDLEMASNPFIGLSLLATVGRIHPNCYRALVTGHIDTAVRDLCQSIGLNDVFAKDNMERVIDRVAVLLKVKIDADQLHAKYRKLLNAYKTLQQSIDKLEHVNKEIRRDRNRLRRSLRELQAQKVPKKKDIEKTSNAVKNQLEKRAASAEQRVQMVLGHQHDLQSIASAVTTTLGNLCAQPELLPPAIKDKLEGAWTASKHTYVLISSTLDIATDEKPSTRATGSIPLAFDEANRIISEQLPDRITVNISLPKEMRATKIPDNMLVRCALNLFNNAKDGMVGRGQIEVTTKTKSTARVKHVEVVVRDTGQGIKKRDIPRVFDWGFTTKGRRYGMGLFIVRKIMERYGGQVKIESVRGKGTAVILSIPVG